ncbi:MAG: carbohydrate ABC transporter permease [Clostridia bacterium]|nr:carbohydrate ABC transporter permease [Clostridia bacterium]
MKFNKDAAALERRREKLRRVMLGSAEKRGLLGSSVVYLLLIVISFIFLYPVLYMISRSLMSRNDLLDSSAMWIPSSITLHNYESAILTMDYWMSLLKNLYLAAVPTLAQVFVCSMVGYGFARYNFPFKKAWMGILILAFLLPSQTTALPNYLVFQNLRMIDGTIKPFLITAVLGQGFKSTLCILIFYNFHRQVPQSLIEAAEIDGAGHLKAYFRIAIPLAGAAIVVVTLFSFVWYWNETYLVRNYLGYGATRATGLTTLMLELNAFEDSYANAYTTWASSVTSSDRINDAIRMAGTVLAIAPLMILYFVLQKQFVESVDKAGITGE